MGLDVIELVSQQLKTITKGKLESFFDFDAVLLIYYTVNLFSILLLLLVDKILLLLASS